MTDAEIVFFLVLVAVGGYCVGRLHESYAHITHWSRGYAQGLRGHHRINCEDFATGRFRHDEHKPDMMPQAHWDEAGRW